MPTTSYIPTDWYSRLLSGDSAALEGAANQLSVLARVTVNGYARLRGDIVAKHRDDLDREAVVAMFSCFKRLKSACPPKAISEVTPYVRQAIVHQLTGYMQEVPFWSPSASTIRKAIARDKKAAESCLQDEPRRLRNAVLYGDILCAYWLAAESLYSENVALVYELVAKYLECHREHHGNALFAALLVEEGCDALQRYVQKLTKPHRSHKPDTITSRLRRAINLRLHEFASSPYALNLPLQESATSPFNHKYRSTLFSGSVLDLPHVGSLRAGTRYDATADWGEELDISGVLQRTGSSREPNCDHEGAGAHVRQSDLFDSIERYGCNDAIDRKIVALLANECTIEEIAARLKRHPGTISRRLSEIEERYDAAHGKSRPKTEVSTRAKLSRSRVLGRQ